MYHVYIIYLYVTLYTYTHTHTHIYIYIYSIYICVCVCVCVYVYILYTYIKQLHKLFDLYFMFNRQYPKKKKKGFHLVAAAFSSVHRHFLIQSPKKVLLFNTVGTIPLLWLQRLSLQQLYYYYYTDYLCSVYIWFTAA
jgi:hypothetical protein